MKQAMFSLRVVREIINHRERNDLFRYIAKGTTLTLAGSASVLCMNIIIERRLRSQLRKNENEYQEEKKISIARRKNEDRGKQKV